MPFNGKDTHMLQQYFKNVGIRHIPNRSAEDPETTGQVESFMKHPQKIFHMAGVAREDTFLRINDYLMLYRATPHSTMKKYPAELLFNRKLIIKLPDHRVNPAKDREDIKEAREEDRKAKVRMKEMKDNGRGVKEHIIKEGDEVLLKKRQTKHEGLFHPHEVRHPDYGGKGRQGEDEGRSEVEDGEGGGQEELLGGRDQVKVPGGG